MVPNSINKKYSAQIKKQLGKKPISNDKIKPKKSEGDRKVSSKTH
jgi:hypothetical protein